MKCATLSLLFSLSIISPCIAQTWTQVSSPSTSTLYGISFSDSSHGVSAGAADDMVQYGTLWYNSSPPSCGSEFNDVQAVGSNYIYAVATANVGSYVSGHFLRSSNGGSTFVCDTFPTYAPQLNYEGFYATKIFFHDSVNGFVAGNAFDNNSNFSKGQILQTTNGGVTWTYRLSKLFNSNLSDQWGMADLFFTDYLHGFAVTSQDSLLVTTDGGTTWISKMIPSTQSIASIYFRNQTLGWAAGASGTLLKTIDGGTTWNAIHLSYGDDFVKITFSDTMNAWLVGGDNIYHSVDGGATWQLSGALSVEIYDISMISNSLGYACGDNGAIYKYTCPAVTTTPAVSICAGQAYSLGGISYTSSGSYSATLPSAGGCDSVVQLTLTVNPLPVPVVSDNNGVLSTNSFASYQWLYNGAAVTGATSQTFSPTFMGNYSVEVTNANGCSAASSVFVVTGTQDISPEIFSMSPNPTADVVFVSIMEPFTGSMKLRDIMGRVVTSFELRNETRQTIDMSNLSAGVYILTLEGGNGGTSRKVVKE